MKQAKMTRRGFTLSEMLVVLGVLVVVTALAQPALRSTLSDSRLRSGAKTVRAELAKARLKAMQSGAAQRFRYQPGSDRFEIGPAVVNEAGQEELLAAESRENRKDTDEVDAATRLAERVIVQTLPPGVCFDAADTEAQASLLVDEEGWSEPIVFYPNGRTRDAQIRIRGERNAVVEVALRGLTGVVTASRPRHEEEALR